jgi:hypothetical protein
MTLDLFVTNLSSIYVLGVTTQNGATQEGKITSSRTAVIE